MSTQVTASHNRCTGRNMYSTQVAEKLREELKLPEPVGYKVLIAMPTAKDTTKGGVFIPDDLKQRETVASIIGLVVGLGPAAYKDKEKFPDGPYCKKGDFVVFRSYSGTRFRVGDTEFRLINDDTVEAVVEDPTGFERAI